MERLLNSKVPQVRVKTFFFYLFLWVWSMVSLNSVNKEWILSCVYSFTSYGSFWKLLFQIEPAILRLLLWKWSNGSILPSLSFIFLSTHCYPSSSFEALSGACWPDLRSHINTRYSWEVMSYVKGTKRIRNSTRIVTLDLETLLRMGVRLGSS